MDIKILANGLLLTLQLILTISPVSLKSVGRDCRKCKPGYYVSRQCSTSHDTVCQPCRPGTYSHEHNLLEKCPPCSTCEAGEFVLHECNARKNTVCESCAAIKDNINANFLRSCIQGDDPNSKIRLTDSSEVKLDQGETYETLESSSDYTVVLPEGSGAGIILEPDDTTYPLVNETDTIEGSGVIPDDDTANATVTVILTDDGDEDSLTTTTTTREGVIDLGPGIVLDNTTSDTSNIDTEVVKPNTVTTTARVITADFDETISIQIYESEPEDTINTVDIDLSDETVNDEPQTGASHTQHPRERIGVSTGVVVAVGLVAAFVFFVIGFVVSRYWSRRRERTFNVQEAERRNGKPPIECSGIEYKDPENNIPAKPNVYASLPNKTANGGTPEIKPHTDAPIVKSAAPATGSQPNTKTDDDGDREWAGFSLTRNDSSGSLILLIDRFCPSKPRAESEIRYIDEDPADEGENEALLPTSNDSTNENQAGKQSESGSSSGTDSNNGLQADETTPMISNNNSSGTNKS